MDLGELRRTSAEERALYRELLAAYRTLATLTEEGVDLDPDRLAAEQARAEAATTALRELRLALAPHRLGGEAIPADVEHAWRESAALAAEATGTTATLITRARARQSAIRERLATLARGRRALAGYRPVSGLARGLSTSA